MRWIALVLFGIAATAIPAAAQDIPGRVGRLAYLEGSAGAYHDPQIGWEQAFVNSPITSENSVWTEPGARAELQLGGTAVRLDGATQLDISRLDDLVFDAAVVRGSVGLRVRYKQRDDRYVISTPQARFVIDTDGRYRIDVAPENDESRLTVFSGTAHLERARERAGRCRPLGRGLRRVVAIRVRPRLGVALRPLGARARRAVARFGREAICLALYDGIRGPRSLRRVDYGRGLRRAVEAY